MSRRYRVLHGEDERTAEIGVDGLVTVDGHAFEVAEVGPGLYRVTDGHGLSTRVSLAGPAHELWAGRDGRARALVVDGSPAKGASGRTAAFDMTAPMPATVVKVAVAVGDRVTAGAPVVVLEAMKMELTVRAARDGVVKAVSCAVGDLVKPGVRLVEIDA